MRKRVGIIKQVTCLGLVFLLSINSFAAIVSDNDGSAFITKSEFDALKSSFQSQIDSYNQSIDSKIDGAIASYLSGIHLATTFPQQIPWGTSGVKFTNLPAKARFGYCTPAIYFRPFACPVESVFTLNNLPPLNYETYEGDPKFVNDAKKLPFYRYLTIANSSIGAKAGEYMAPGWKEKNQTRHGSDWPTWYKSLTDTQEKKDFWFDTVTSSSYLTKSINGFNCVSGIGRISVVPKINLIGVTCASGSFTALIAKMDDAWDSAWQEVNGNWYSTTNSLSALKSHLSKGQYGTGSPALYQYVPNNATLNWSISVATASNLMTAQVRIAPLIYTNDNLSGVEKEIEYVDWLVDDNGWEGTWTFSIVDRTKICQVPAYNNWDTMVLGGNTSGTTISCQKVPGVNCGEILINEDYGGAFFDPDSLWCKETSKEWIEQSLLEWHLGTGPIASDIMDFNGSGDNPTYTNMGMNVQYINGVLAQTGPLQRPDCEDIQDLGKLPGLRITPTEAEKRKINDFYAPLYASDTMSSYGKSYVDGACICNVSTNGDLIVKLKSTNNTTLYFNKNPFGTCDEAGNIAYIANNVNKSAGEGVSVGANDIVTITFPSVSSGERYYVKPSSATTINFLSVDVVSE